MDDVAKTFCDVLKTCAWGAGVLFRQFELGREGYFPELASKNGKDAIRDIKERRIKKSETKPSKNFPMGFA